MLEARCGISYAGLDVFLNVAGGMRVNEPAADLAIAGAILSAREDVAIPPDMVLFGEISLSGALRPVGQTENRLKEASKLGFTQAIAPTRSKLGQGTGMRVPRDARPDGVCGRYVRRGLRNWLTAGEWNMDGFTLIDGISAGVIVLSAILAYSRGFVREAMAIAGWVGAAILAFLFAPTVQPLVKEIPVLNNFLADNCELSIVAAFAGVFALGLIVASLFTPLFSSVVQRSALGGVDQGLGFLFGVARGVLLIAVAFFVYDKASADQFG